MSHLVELWLCPLTGFNQNPQQIALTNSWLSEDELRKVTRFRQQDAQTQARLVRGYLRTLLSRYAPLSPSQWIFEYGDKGKPRLCVHQRQQTGLEFNLSHSKDYLLIGITSNKQDSLMLGVDIEHSRENTDIHSIMNHYFSCEEILALQALEPAQQRVRFFDLWALKESYIKATGKGLATSLKDFHFDFSGTKKWGLNIRQTSERVIHASNLDVYKELAIRFVEGKNERQTLDGETVDSMQWQSFLGRIEPNYRFAVTVGGCDSDIHIEMETFSLSNLQ